jgi:uncharacterized membrane protein YfcA
MEVIAYLASAIIGVSLGLTGGGGSILTVPVLVYLFGINPLLATSYSLFIVGSTSLITTLGNLKQKLVNVKVALIFGTSSTSTVFLIRKLLIPVIPQNIFQFGNFIVTEDMLMLSLFALLMIAAAISMIFSSESKAQLGVKPPKATKILAYGVGIGLITGLLGAGGGFLLIPALLLFLRLKMKESIATSLFIIALNSSIGFIGDLGHFNINWPFLLTITAIAITGSFAGMLLNKRMNEDKLKKGFGWFILLMGVSMIIKEIFFKLI